MESSENLLSNLVLISQIDAAMARMAAERKRLENEAAALKAKLRSGEGDRQSREKALKDKKIRLQREEKSLKEEQEKLIARRKALTTFSNYKLQQAAEREIEHASRQLRIREEALLSAMEESDKLEQECLGLQESCRALGAALSALLEESRETFSSFEERGADYRQKRAALAAQVEERTLALYERISERHPCDAVVAVKNHACTGCFIQVAPQLLVQIAQGNAVVKCRGCGRILYLEEDASASGAHPGADEKNREE